MGGCVGLGQEELVVAAAAKRLANEYAQRAQVRRVSLLTTRSRLTGCSDWCWALGWSLPGEAQLASAATGSRLCVDEACVSGATR